MWGSAFLEKSSENISLPPRKHFQTWASSEYCKHILQQKFAKIKMMFLLHAFTACLFILECSGFHSVLHRSDHLWNGTSPHRTSLTSLTSTGQTVRLDLSPTPHNLDGSSYTSGTLSLDATEILSFTLRNVANGSAKIELQYGELFTGIQDVTYNLQGSVIEGSIDGRTLDPIGLSDSNATLGFQDGHGIPKVTVSADLTRSNFNTSLQDIRSQILSNESHTTLLPRTLSGLYTDPLSALQLRQNLDYNQDPGHSSNTEGSAGCIICTTEVTIIGDAGAANCIGVCAALWFTSDCPNCWNDLNNNVNSLTTRCSQNFCCPVDCGSNCCDDGEACLSTSSGLCCSYGESACGGKTCCAGDQTCMPDGSCCPTSAAIDGSCCPASGICGNACCGLLLDCMAPGLCCLPGSVLDGGICCGAGQYNDGGTCCDVGTSVCGSSGCCLGTCNNGVCSSNASGCEAAGGSGATCTVSADCPFQVGYDDYCSDGCCFYEKHIE